ncbi:MAG: hypothetical protein ACLUOI_30860 [Eisenbergiella sp.]
MEEVERASLLEEACSRYQSFLHRWHAIKLLEMMGSEKDHPLEVDCIIIATMKGIPEKIRVY